MSERYATRKQLSAVAEHMDSIGRPRSADIIREELDRITKLEHAAEEKERLATERADRYARAYFREAHPFNNIINFDAHVIRGFKAVAMEVDRERGELQPVDQDDLSP